MFVGTQQELIIGEILSFLTDADQAPSAHVE